jgi:hypothetical protein
MLLNDVGQTFGKANFLNRDNVSSVNFDGWSKTSVWQDKKSCIGNISLSGRARWSIRTSAKRVARFSGTPRAIDRSPASRSVRRRTRRGCAAASRAAGEARHRRRVGRGVQQKRDEIVNRRCDDLTSRHASH